jgi:YVTN family beta-propeller protein
MKTVPTVFTGSIGRRAFGVTLAAVLAAAGCGSPAPAPASPEAPPSYQVLVSDETGGNIVVINGDTGAVTHTVPVGKRPRGLRVSRDGMQVLVALSGSPIAPPGVDESKLPPPDRSADGIGVVDLGTMTLTRTLQSGQDPETFDTSLDGAMLFVANEDAAQMTALDVASGEIRGRVEVGEEPEGVTVRPDGGVVYVTCEETNEVVAVDTASLKVVARIKTGARPRAVAFLSDSSIGFSSDENSGTVSVIDAQKHTVLSTIKIPQPTTSTVPPRPMGIELSPDGRWVYVGLGRAQAVAVIDATARTFSRLIENVGQRPWGVAVSPDGATLYTANGPGADVSVIDIASGTVRQRIPTGGSPWGVAISAAR